jgi:hypothetical protein
MHLLSGWKEIAEHLHLNVRTAQRWEKLGLPIRRPYDSACSPVIADSAELEQWATRRKTRAAGYAHDAGSTLGKQLSQLESVQRRISRRTRRLLSQIAAAQTAQQQLLSNIRANCRQSVGTATYSWLTDQASLPGS